MKTLFAFLLLFMMMSPAFIAQGTAQNKESRSVEDDFTEVSAASGVNVFVKQGTATEVVVEGDEDIIDRVRTEVKGNVLNVDIDRGFFSWFTSGSASVYVTMKEVTGLHASGGADLKSSEQINADKIKISSSGGADAVININASEVYLNSSGGADIVIEGKTDYLEAHASGGADIKARKLIAREVIASSSGGADVEVFASEQLEASASGGADVDYYGDPSVNKVTESGGGDVSGH